MSMTFRGDTYDAALDGARLNAQQKRVFEAVKGGSWYTLGEISTLTGDPEASVSARLRDLRAVGYTVERRRVENGNGLHQYRVLPA